MDQEPIIRWKLNPLAGHIGGVGFGLLAQPVSQLIHLGRRVGCHYRLAGFDLQGGFIVANADDVNPLLFRIDKVDARLKHLLLDPLDLLGAWVIGFVGYHPHVPWRDQGRISSPNLGPGIGLYARIYADLFELKCVTVNPVPAGR